SGKEEVLAPDPAEVLQSREEYIPGSIIKGSDIDAKNPDPRDPAGWLRLGGQGLKSEADSEHDREPDPPHGYLDRDGWRESSRTCIMDGSSAPPLASPR